MKLKKSLCFVCGIVFLFSSFVGCFNTKDGSNVGVTPIPQKALEKVSIPIHGEPVSLNPFLFSDSYSYIVLRHISESLISLDENNNAIPAMAQSWEISKDGLKYKFILRDTKWSDGTPISANDFVFVINKILVKENTDALAIPILSMLKNAVSYRQGKAKFEEVGVKAINDKTLELELEKPASYFLLSLATLFPINPKAYNQYGAEYGKESTKISSNGPWVVKEWLHQSKLVLEKNPNYWDASKIKLDEITFRIVDDSVSQYNLFLSDELDFSEIATQTYQKATDKGFEVKGYSCGSYYLSFNLKDSFLKNKNIRKALGAVIDRQLLTTTIIKGSQPAYNFNPPAIKGEKNSFSKEIGPLFKDDINEGKRLFALGLKELGLKSPPKLVLSISSGSDSNLNAFFVESYNKYLGLKVETRILGADFFDKLCGQEFQMSLCGYEPDYNDPINYLSLYGDLDSGSNYSYYTNKEFSKMLLDASRELDVSKRINLLKTAEKKLIEDAPISPIYFQTSNYIIKPRLKGLIASPFDVIDLRNAYIEKK